MSKITFPYDDEIKLNEIIKILWNGKIKIVLIAFVSLLAAFIYNYLKPLTYVSSIKVEINKDYRFTKILNIKNSINILENLNYPNNERIYNLG